MKILYCGFLLYLTVITKEVIGEDGDYQIYAPQPLCDVDGIRQEISKAIAILKLKALEQSANGKINLLRQDEDDDGDIPYYVPAIAKVVASVLAQNATNVIEESFGFIPPEVNKNIRYVLGLVAETVNKLRPTPPAPTVAAVAAKTQPPSVTPIIAQVPIGVQNQVPQIVGNPTQSKEQAANIEAILAYALAQQLITKDTTKNPLTVTDPAIPASSVIATEIAPVSFTSTFRYSQGQSITSGSRLPAVSDELPVYAPAYAPNYGVTTTRSPMYAPAFYYKAYTTEPVIKNTSLIASNNLNATTVIADSETSTEAESEGTTEDYYDENVTEDLVTSTVKVISKLSSNASTATPTDGEDYYDT